MSTAPVRGDHWCKGGPQPSLTSLAHVPVGAAGELRKSPVNDTGVSSVADRKRLSPTPRSGTTQVLGRSPSPNLSYMSAAAPTNTKTSRPSAKTPKPRSPSTVPRKSPVPVETRGGSRSPPQKLNTRSTTSSAQAEAPRNASPRFGNEFLNMSLVRYPRQIDPETQDILRTDRGLQSEVELQREYSVYPLMTSSTASFVAVNRESDDSDSDTQTEPLPYAKGTSAIPFQREGQCTLANIESLSDETLEDLMAQITLTLNRRRINPNSVLFPSTTHQYSKSSPARLPKSKDKAQVASEHNDKKLHKRPKSDPAHVPLTLGTLKRFDAEYADPEVASITSGPCSSDEHDQWGDRRASAPNDKMFRSQFLGEQDGHCQYAYSRTVVDGRKKLNRVKALPISPQITTPDRERSVRSLTSPRSAFDDVSSQSESSTPPPL